MGSGRAVGWTGFLRGWETGPTAIGVLVVGGGLLVVGNGAGVGGMIGLETLSVSFTPLSGAGGGV